MLRPKHPHLVDGKQKRVKVTLTRRLPAGRSSVTLKGRLATIKLFPDMDRIVGTATNPAGASPARRARLVVVPSVPVEDRRPAMTTASRRMAAVITVALVAAVLSPASATAAPTWLPAQQLVEASEAF